MLFVARGRVAIAAIVLAVAAVAADKPAEPHWESYQLRGSCVLTGTALSRKLNDAFEVQFRAARRDRIEFFMLIPNAPKGGVVRIGLPTTHERWTVSTNSLMPALTGIAASTLARNVKTGVPIEISIRYGDAQEAIYETMPRDAQWSGAIFAGCLAEMAP